MSLKHCQAEQRFSCVNVCPTLSPYFSLSVLMAYLTSLVNPLFFPPFSEPLGKTLCLGKDFLDVFSSPRFIVKEEL